MKRPLLLHVLVFCYAIGLGQDIPVTFSGSGASLRVDSVMATNLRSGQGITMPGNDILILTRGSGITEAADQAGSMIIFPNPFQGRARFIANTKQPMTAILKIQNLVGQLIAESREQVQSGENEFEITLNQEGIYLVSLITEEGIYCKKILCSLTNEAENRIIYLGSTASNQNNKNKYDDPAFPGLKITQTIHYLGYADGDIIMYRCTSGNFTTIIADSPIMTKNYEVYFQPCSDRDGKNYSIVKIGTQIWMAENLAYLPAVSPSAAVSDTAVHYYVHGYDGTSVGEARATDNYATYGALYNWPAAMDGASASNSVPSGVKGVCPSGWHLPGDAEWKILEKYLGMSEDDADLFNTFRSSGEVDKKIKSSTGWSTDKDGDNSSGFTALPGGYFADGFFHSLGKSVSFWSASLNITESLGIQRFIDPSNYGSGVFRGTERKSLGLSVRCLKDETTDIVKPTVTTSTITEVTGTTATGGGNVTGDGGGAVTSRGVCWSTSQNPTIAGSKTADGAGTGIFTSSLTGLTTGTAYYLRAYATNSAGTAYGEQLTFITGDFPVLITKPVTQITTNEAHSGGNITSAGGSDITRRGVCWSTAPAPVIDNNPNKTEQSGGTGEYSSLLTSLTPNTLYYVRAYATNATGTGYGNQVPFTTDKIIVVPTVTTAAITGITQTTASGGGNVTSDGGASVIDRGICWSTSQNPTIANSKTINGTGTGVFTSNLTGLTAGTNYYVRAYATNSAGTGYGGQVPFTSGPVILPTVTTTSPITEITQTTAKGGGNVTSDGGDTVTARGVCWSTSQNPTIADSKTSDGTGMGSFTSSLTGLTAGTFYYVRAYATNSAGTAYGQEVPFTTAEGNTGTFTDSRDGKVYNWVRIDDQTWMAQNLAYLPAVSSSATGSGSNPRYYVYGYEGTSVTTAKTQASFTTYGALYNWPAALASCPEGWHLPSDAEWTDLRNFLGSTAGGQMKEAGTAHWDSPNTGATNSSGFTALAGGARVDVFNNLRTGAYFWSSTSNTLENAWLMELNWLNDVAARPAYPKNYGLSVRCLKGAVEPTVTTSAITNITETTATCDGTVTSDGGASVTARGICWSTSQNPTIADSKTSDGTGTGSFTSSLTGLTAGTLYFVRAYATNSAGTAYGEEVSFRTANETGTFADSREGGHVYKWVKIGTQTWMAENLAYLPAVSPSASGSETALNYYVYGYEGTSVSTAKTQVNYTTYGALYNWPAALTACPSGWHLPSDPEWTTLTDYLTNNGYGYGGSGDDIGKSMASISGWTTYSTAGTVGNDQASNNSSGFTALPGGDRYETGGFYNLGLNAYFWSSTEYGWSYAWRRHLYYYYGGVYRYGAHRGYGFSVRCLKNN